ncbi:MAG: glutamyl-tRNA reductase [Gemmatimonadales bacterium]
MWGGERRVDPAESVIARIPSHVLRWQLSPLPRSTRISRLLVTASAVESGLRLDCLGISHRTASSEIRERAGFSAALLRTALSAARHDPRIERLVIVSTCHRTELYGEIPHAASDSAARLLEWWSSHTGLDEHAIASHCYSLSGIDTARHLFRVAAGLDSVVLGEAQIVAQVASSLRQSVAVHAASPLLKLTFKSAVRAGERARGSVWGRLQAASLGSAAIDAAAAASNGLAGLKVVVVGAGEIAELALRSLAAHTPARVTIANRTLESALEMAARHGAEVCQLELLPSLLRDADVVVAATRATHTLIDRTTVTAALEYRPTRPMTLIDVSLPRNVDVDVRRVPGAQLIGIDDLGSYVAAAHSERRVVVPAVERLIEEELDLLRMRLARRHPAPAHDDATIATTMAV